MSSILTNNSAMVALDTLRNINKNLATVQNEISTGKKIGSAKDNAAIWAISTVMSTDVDSFKQISDSLNLGNSTVGVARSASEKITSLLQDMKNLIVSAQEGGVDRDKIQTDVAAIRTSIGNIVNAAQFNGQNLLKGTDSVAILASLDRSSDGSVAATKITVNRADLSTGAAVPAAAKTASDAGYVSTADTVTTTDEDKDAADGGAISTAISGTIAASGTGTLTLKAGAIAAGDKFSLSIDGHDVVYTAQAGDTINEVAAGLKADFDASVTDTDIVDATFTFSDVADPAADDLAITITNTDSSNALDVDDTAISATYSQGAIADGDDVEVGITGGTIAVGETFTVNVGGADYTYTAVADDTNNTVAAGLKTLIDAAGISNLTVTVADAADPTADSATLTLTADGGDVVANLGGLASTSADVAAGGLGALASLDVSTEAGAAAALTTIESLLNTAIDAAATFGSAQKQIESQSDFVMTLIDSMTSGIGSLTDADMEAASAKLQALQVQQQLGVQALSIANQAPQALLSLFR
ncbi:flagellin [Hyphomonas oceanitis]|uniref:flagellin n=1 Tax=Hyphomonas oceanitis TaxID=81033 RepID=UPI0030037617